MKIAMLGSLGNVNRVAVPELLNAGHEVTLLTSSADRVVKSKNSAHTRSLVQ